MRRTPLWRYVLSGLPLILVFAGVAYWLHARGVLVGFETLALETFAIMHERRPPAPHVSIVAISDDYYKKNFLGTYPLRGKPLDDLIGAIAKGKPKLIAVDLDSSRWTDVDVAALPTNVTIIWARDIERKATSEHEDENQYCGLPVLDKKGLDDEFTGIAAFPSDIDGVIREYPRFLRIDGLCGDPQPRTSIVQSFALAVSAAYNDQTVHQFAPEDSKVIMNFLGEGFQFPLLGAEDVIAAASGAGSVFATQGPLKGRIALLGGTYHASHDEHATPRGIISGVEIVAQAIETELTGGGIRAANEWRMILLEIALGVVLLGVGYLLTARWAIVINLVVFMVLAPLASYWSYSTKAEWANFVPMLFAAVIHSLWHHTPQQEAENADRAKTDQRGVVAGAPL
jgi:CHASE2 domain-containing sensor protein